MKQSKIKSTYYISLFLNLVFTIVKILGGILGRSETLLVDGLNTLCEFISNLISLVGNKISHKRSNRTHPFGYGNVEYITNLFVGIIISILGFWMLGRSFVGNGAIPDVSLVVILLIVIIGKLILGIFLNSRSTTLHSSSLLISSRQCFIDLYSSILTLVVIILCQFADYFPILLYSDLVGSIIISLMIINTGYTVIKENVLPLSGEALVHEQIEEEIESKIEKIVNVDLTHVHLIKNGAYFQAMVTVRVNPKVNAARIVEIENKINKKLKHSKYNIKYVFINFELDS